MKTKIKIHIIISALGYKLVLRFYLYLEMLDSNADR